MWIAAQEASRRPVVRKHILEDDSLTPDDATEHNNNISVSIACSRKNQGQMRQELTVHPEISLKNTDWNGRRWTIIITHGFRGTIFTSWMQELETSLLDLVSRLTLICDGLRPWCSDYRSVLQWCCFLLCPPHPPGQGRYKWLWLCFTLKLIMIFTPILLKECNLVSLQWDKSPANCYCTKWVWAHALFYILMIQLSWML